MKKLFAVLLALFALTVSAQVIVGPSLNYSWNVVSTTSTGQVGSYISFTATRGPVPVSHTVSWVVSGTAPTTCTYTLQGSGDGTTWYTMGTAGVDCKASGVQIVTPQAVTSIRLNLVSWVAGDSTSKVVFSYAGGGGSTGAAPVGPAGGGLTGTYPNPGIAVAPALVRIGQTIVAGSSTSTITFSAIPGTYTNLRLVITGRQTIAVVNANVNCTVNGDGGANYDWGLMFGGNSAVSKFATTAATSVACGHLPGSTATANQAGSIIVNFLNYADSTSGFFKQFIGQDNESATVTAGQYDVGVTMGTWRSTAAITSITLTTQSGTGNFVAGTKATLYGEM